MFVFNSKLDPAQSNFAQSPKKPNKNPHTFLKPPLILPQTPHSQKPLQSHKADAQKPLDIFDFLRPNVLQSQDKKLLQAMLEYSKTYKTHYEAIKEINTKSCAKTPETPLLHKINAKLKECKTTSAQEAQNAQNKLNAKADRLVLNLFKQNACLRELLTPNSFNPTKKQSKEQEQLSQLLLEYSKKEGYKNLDAGLHTLLQTIPEILQSGINTKAIDSNLLSALERGINLYRMRKIEASLYSFFLQASCMTEIDSEIVDAIASIIGFYTQANSIKHREYKISWIPKFQSTTAHEAIENLSTAHIAIAFQILMIFPTHYKL